MSEISQKYKKLTQIEHVIKKPGMYIGEVKPRQDFQWIYNSSSNKMEFQEIVYSPGLYKIFDEIIVNALDESTRDKTMTQIKVSIDQDTISVYNDGVGIPIVIHPEHKIYVPELIFANLLTSTNYDDSQKRVTGGTHGLGAKLTAIFSKEMIVEIGDPKNKKSYYQVYQNNLSKISKPVIKKYTEKNGYVKITFVPDYPKFDYQNLNKSNKNLMMKRTWDIAALSPENVSIFLNDQEINVKSFDQYVNLYLEKDTPMVKFNKGGWQIILTDSQSEKFNQVSFVNGINTSKGGKHVDYITDQITSYIQKIIKKSSLKDSYIKDNFWIFIKAEVVNPSFSSQTKEELITNKNDFGIEVELSSSFFKKIKDGQINLINNVLMYLKSREMAKFAKSDGSKKSRLKNIPKLDDANFAGTKKSGECTLILTEGDSAKAMAISGLSAIKNGRNYYGVFPLKGKLLNVRDASSKQINDNDEINNLKKIIGLQTGTKYTNENLGNLRYGSIMLMMDADVDGSHIKGLFLNMLEYYWPSLLKIEGFIKVLVTPVVKAINKDKIISFKNLTEYEQWRNSMDYQESKKWFIKYYKGLGTSTSKEAKEYFDKIEQYLMKVTDERKNVKDKDTHPEILLAFSKKLADQRKKWLGSYDRDNIIEFKDNIEISLKDFVNKELIHFSNYDNIRSIPSLLDGLKPSQRKVLFACFKRNLTSDIKVAQLAGYVSEHTAYHHGENSLVNTIINMAQNYIGSNNINLLEPVGQFGTRLVGGKDHSSARYIFTMLSEVTRKIFHKDDDPIYNYLDDDGTNIEPEFYLPIIPMVLVNGSEGIGTGYSTSLPSFRPEDIKNYLIERLNGGNPSSNFYPFYQGFKGKMIKIDSKNYISQGIYIIDNKYLKIEELPVGYWTQDFKDYLEDFVYKTKYFSSYQDNGTESTVEIYLKINDLNEIQKLDSKVDKYGLSDLSKLLKLNKTVKLTNMHLYDSQGKIKKYNSVKEILEEYYTVRLGYYQKRKDYLMEKLDKETKIFDSQVKFITGLINNKIKISNKSKQDIINILKKEKLYLIKDEPEYEYLTRMPIYSFSKEKVEDLNRKYNDKKNEFNLLKNKTINQLWLADLNFF